MGFLSLYERVFEFAFLEIIILFYYFETSIFKVKRMTSTWQKKLFLWKKKRKTNFVVVRHTTPYNRIGIWWYNDIMTARTLQNVDEFQVISVVHAKVYTCKLLKEKERIL